ncbi:MAG: SpoIIIAC/SpoIIIAD family protein [Clostridia bacterium]
MEILKVVGFAIISVVLIIILNEQKKEMALILTIFACLGIMIFALSKMLPIIDMLNELVEKSGMNKEFLNIILKVTAIAYIVEFGKNICIDSGQSAIATKLEMTGKVLIVSLSIPLISALVNVLTGLV